MSISLDRLMIFGDSSGRWFVAHSTPIGDREGIATFKTHSAALLYAVKLEAALIELERARKMPPTPPLAAWLGLQDSPRVHDCDWRECWCAGTLRGSTLTPRETFFVHSLNEMERTLRKRATP